MTWVRSILFIAVSHPSFLFSVHRSFVFTYCITLCNSHPENGKAVGETRQSTERESNCDFVTEKEDEIRYDNGIEKEKADKITIRKQYITGGNDMSVITITNANFEKEVLQSEKPVLLDFWAAWCGPCRMVSPVIDEIAEERSDIRVGKINVDEEQELAEAFQVMSIPTLVVMKEGKVVNKSMGAKPKNQILAML